MKISTKNHQKTAERMVHVRLTQNLHRRLRVLVAARDETIQDFLSALVAREVELHMPQALEQSELSR